MLVFLLIFFAAVSLKIIATINVSERALLFPWSECVKYFVESQWKIDDWGRFRLVEEKRFPT